MNRISKTPPKQKKRYSLKATYDASRTNRLNENHWSAANFTSADLDASAAVRKQLRIRARYEVQNNSYAKGIALTLANDCIGTGARIQINNCPDEVATQIEKDFTAWSKAVGLAEKLRSARYCKLVDGEAFLFLTTNPKINNNVKLDIQLIDADRVTSLDYSFTEQIVDGIKLDKYGNVVSYSVYDKHPSENALAELKTIPEKYIIHLYNVDRAGQHRGVSELAPCLGLFAQLRDWTQATLTAAQIAANVTGFIETDAPAGGESEELEPLEEIPLQTGQLMTLPAGWKFATTKPEQPTSTYKEFKNELLSEIARCLNTPFNIAKCDSQAASYASSRLDTQIYFKTIKLEQQYFIRNCLERIFAEWIKEYTLDGKVKLPAFTHSFMFEMGMVEHSDPQKLANAQAQQLKSLTVSLAEIYAEKGKDYQAELKQIAYERKLMKELGLTFEDVEQNLVNDTSIDNVELNNNGEQ